MASGTLLFLVVSFVGFYQAIGGPVGGENSVLDDTDSNTPRILNVAIKVLPGAEEKEASYAIPKAESPPPPIKIGAEEVGVPESTAKPNCITMMIEDAEMYEYEGCKITELFEGCYTKPVCPEACTAENGTLMELDGPRWGEKQGKVMCECVTIGAVLFSPPVPPPGAGPWPPFKHCQTNGCLTSYGDEDTYVPPGGNTSINGLPCSCVEGTDPFLMDASTLYHWKCEGESSEDLWTSEEISEGFPPESVEESPPEVATAEEQPAEV